MSNPSNSPFLVIFIFSLLSTSLDFFFPPEYKNHKEHRGSMEINRLLFLSLTPQIQPDSFALSGTYLILNQDFKSKLLVSRF